MVTLLSYWCCHLIYNNVILFLFYFTLVVPFLVMFVGNVSFDIVEVAFFIVGTFSWVYRKKKGCKSDKLYMV